MCACIHICWSLPAPPHSQNPYNFPTDKSTRSIFCTDIWPSNQVPDPESLGVSWVIGESFVLLKHPLAGSWMGAGHQEHQAVIRNLELSFLPPSSRKGRGAGNWVNDPSCLSDEASITKQIMVVQRASGLGNTSACQGGGTPQLHRDQRSSRAWDSSRSSLLYLFVWLFSVSLIISFIT